jgi:myo-inositol-1(or 4)-monophosphatase
MPIMPSASLTTALAVATQAAQAAGNLLASFRGRPVAYATKRHAADLVTNVDRASERLIHAIIRKRFPEHGFYGEERTRTHRSSPWQWLVDPLDGTTNFVHGVPVFAVSIGLVHEGRPVLGVIYDPSYRELFTAVRGRGARLNGRRMRVSPTRRLADSLFSTGFSVKFRRNPAPYLRWFQAFQSRCHAVRRSGSTAISLAYVAAGRLEGFYEQDLWPWDIAAGIVLVEEAGGRVSDFRDRPVQFKAGEVVASNGHLHEKILTLLAPPVKR